jgi:hypothetical protein
MSIVHELRTAPGDVTDTRWGGLMIVIHGYFWVL